jgi:hypothetical protein
LKFCACYFLSDWNFLSFFLFFFEFNFSRSFVGPCIIRILFEERKAGEHTGLRKAPCLNDERSDFLVLMRLLRLDGWIVVDGLILAIVLSDQRWRSCCFLLRIMNISPYFEHVEMEDGEDKTTRFYIYYITILQRRVIWKLCEMKWVFILSTFEADDVVFLPCALWRF